ncbi:MAG TPA: hypothetical protein VJ982_09245 [Gemmatimonadota bacterium]|nr:hypothetical protein [Gemmatimonadota bacterium]
MKLQPRVACWVHGTSSLAVCVIVLGFAVLSAGAALATVLMIASGALIALVGSWLVWTQFSRF